MSHDSATAAIVAGQGIYFGTMTTSGGAPLGGVLGTTAEEGGALVGLVLSTPAVPDIAGLEDGLDVGPGDNCPPPLVCGVVCARAVPATSIIATARVTRIALLPS